MRANHPVDNFPEYLVKLAYGFVRGMIAVDGRAAITALN
jgi:hypothetical protein